MKWLTFTRPIRYLLAVAIFVVFAGIGFAQPVTDTWPATLSQEQIVDRMQKHDQMQMEILSSYHALRHYEVEYRGLSKTLTARMDVEVYYDGSFGKSFLIVSETGSKTLCAYVLHLAIDSEKEASRNRGTTALTRANYMFHLAGSEPLNGRPSYILDVEPIAPNRFLYRGRIWVDGIDFAVARMEVQPSKNPSFWITKTVIHHMNADMGGFWLPQQNRSETGIRFGGTAVMTIDYGTYQIAPQRSWPMVSELR